jgi:hypothetical protein
VLCAHNGASCDFPFLAVEMARAQSSWPEKLRYTLDTYQQTMRFKSLEYHKQDATRWPTRTAKGKPSLAVKPTVEYILKARGAFGKGSDPFASFESACGQAHEACADSIGAAIIFFDAPGLQSKWKEGLCRTMELWKQQGAELLKKPLVEHDKVANGWTEVGGTPTSVSGSTAPPARGGADEGGCSSWLQRGASSATRRRCE